MKRIQNYLATVGLIWLFAISGSAFGMDADQWEKAENKIVRLPPSAFTELPQNLKTHLEKKGCMVPQVTGSTTPKNIVHGNFRNPNQMDWALLCHKDGDTSLIVYWQGDPNKEEIVAHSKDRDYLQSVDDELIWYSHALGIVGEDYIRRHYEAFGGYKPPEVIDHHGINDIWLDKASVVHYWDHGKWLELTGAD